MAPKGIKISKESISDLANRYRVLSNPEFLNRIMKDTTAELISQLYIRMVDLPSHPKDTGLLLKCWRQPEEYIDTHFGKVWEVYLQNTATVGKQYRLKYGKSLYSSLRRRRKRGNPNLLKNKRYMRFVDNRTKFYTKQLKIMRQKVAPIFREIVADYLNKLSRLRPDLFTREQITAISKGEI